MPARRRLATGIYADAYGIAVRVTVHGTSKEYRFPPDTPTAQLIAWRKAQTHRDTTAHPAPKRGSLARDIVRYLRRLKGQPSYKAERSHLRAWLAKWPRLQRWQLSREHVERAIADWRVAGVAPKTMHHRVRVLRAVYLRLDGPDTRTPLDHVVLPPIPRPRPVSVSDDLIATVAANLAKQEQPASRKGEKTGRGRLHDAKTRARFLVLATHAQRPAELARALPADVDLDRRLWFVRGAKGSHNVVIPLSDQQVAAWQLFIAAEAWGKWDSRSWARTLRTAGWPNGIRPYNLRHSTAVSALQRGIDLGDVQGLLGHTSPETTRRFYAGVQIERLAEATAALDGRFPAGVFAKKPEGTGGTLQRPVRRGLPHRTTTIGQDRTGHS